MTEPRRLAPPRRLLAGVAGALLLTPLGGARAAVSPTMSGYVTEQDVGVGLAFADGSSVGSPQLPGPVIPPGTYTVTINDSSQVGDFDLQGPGVSDATPVETREQVTWTVSFEPCQTYSYQNDQQTTSTEWFQTSASATSAAPCAPPVTGAPTTAATDTTPGGPVTTTSNTAAGGAVSAIGTPIGSGAPAILGTLAATVSSGGALSLERNGRAVTRLASGRYQFDAADRSERANFTLVKPGGARVLLTATAFVGTRKVVLELGAGRWTFLSSTAPSSSDRSFTVTGPA